MFNEVFAYHSGAINPAGNGSSEHVREFGPFVSVIRGGPNDGKVKLIRVRFERGEWKLTPFYWSGLLQALTAQVVHTIHGLQTGQGYRYWRAVFDATYLRYRELNRIDGRQHPKTSAVEWLHQVVRVTRRSLVDRAVVRTKVSRADVNEALSVPTLMLYALTAKVDRALRHLEETITLCDSVLRSHSGTPQPVTAASLCELRTLNRDLCNCIAGLSDVADHGALGSAAKNARACLRAAHVVLVKRDPGAVGAALFEANSWASIGRLKAELVLLDCSLSLLVAGPQNVFDTERHCLVERCLRIVSIAAPAVGPACQPGIPGHVLDGTLGLVQSATAFAGGVQPFSKLPLLEVGVRRVAHLVS